MKAAGISAPRNTKTDKYSKKYRIVRKRVHVELPFQTRSCLPNSRPDLVVSGLDAGILLPSVIRVSRLDDNLAVFVCFRSFPGFGIQACVSEDSGQTESIMAKKRVNIARQSQLWPETSNKGRTEIIRPE